MSRTSGVVALFVCLLAGGVSGQQGGPGKVGAAGPRPKECCDMAKLDFGTFCKECGQIIEADGIKDHKEKKDLKAHTLQKKKVCIRKFYHCDAHTESDSFDKGQCCGKEMAERTSKALVMWRCEGCSMYSSDTDKCIDPACTRKKIRTECAAEPMFPHTNEKLWREKKKQEKK